MIKQGRIPVLMYHCVGEAEDPDDAPYWVPEREFERQMAFLKKRGFRLIDIGQLIEGIFEQKPISRRAAVITFDDGHLSFFTKARDIMKKNGQTATMFLIYERVGTQGYMDWAQIALMDSEGFSFESHSMTHAVLTKLSVAEMEKEIAGSKSALERALNKDVKYFSYRGGHYNQLVQSIVSKAGYKAAVCSKYGYNNSDAEVLALRRIPVRGRDSLAVFAAKIFGLDWQKRYARIFARYVK